MDIRTAVIATRTCRRFEQSRPIAATELEELIDLARLAGSARNSQPWQYQIVNEPDTCDAIYPHLGWAGYLSDWRGPAPGERPSAYILCLLNHQWLIGNVREAHFDLGIASQNLLLGAVERNLSGCRIGAIGPGLSRLFNIPEHLSLELVIALGTPSERIVLEESDGRDIRYWHDAAGVHHVPKRRLGDILLHLDLR